MMIKWWGKNCSDGCPFYEVSVSVDPTLRFHSPQCRLSGHKDETGETLDIRPTLTSGKPDTKAKRAKNCPFEDPHGIHIEVHNVSG